MPPNLEIADRGTVTFESAVNEECNMINLASYGPATEAFYQELWAQRSSIEALVRHHLALGRDDRCGVLPLCDWIRGSLNVCVLVEVHAGRPPRNVIFRCPMRHKLAEARYPGSIHEKLGCEVGAHIWIEENCPAIRVPHLFGFGLLDGRHFTHASHLPLASRIARRLWRFVRRCFSLPLLSNYVWHPASQQVSSAYMLLEHLGPDTGRMLSDTFDTYRDDEGRRARLFRGLSRIMLSLARVPQPRIGSFQFHDNGTITLTNRPLSCSMMISENDGADRVLQRGDTYSCTDAYASDMLTFHDHRFLSQPHAAYDEGDCRTQMAVKTLLRVLAHTHIQREHRNGPFLLQLTDFHTSNIVVDSHWNVTGLLDLEWICALPSEMLAVPYWLTGCSIDSIEGEKLDQFDHARQTFMRIFKEEEQAMLPETSHSIVPSKVMQDMWDSRGVWFWYCLSSVNAMYFLLESHLLPPHSLSLEAERILSTFWRSDSEDVVQRKLEDKKAYNEKLHELFESRELFASKQL